MEKKTIGSFIAVLRKASGMTQQDMADKLNISNKAVSRWERDECMPDLSLIPAIAEMFGISCDELLKGERITGNEEKASPKIEKQIKSMLCRTVSRFKSAAYVAIACSFAGIVILLAISYGFYRPVIGFAAMVLVLLGSSVLVLLCLNRLNEQAKNNELFDGLTEQDAAYFKKTRYKFTFIPFFINGTAFMWSLPFILIRDEYFVNSVIVFDEYLKFVPFLVLATISAYVVSSTICRRVFLGEERKFRLEKQAKPLNTVQLVISAVIILTLGVINALNINAYIGGMDVSSGFGPGVPLLAFIILFMLFGALATVYYAVRNKGGRRLMVVTGLRNIGFFIAAVYNIGAYSSVQYYVEQYGWRYFILRLPEYVYLHYFAPPALILAVSIGGYMLLKRYWVKRER